MKKILMFVICLLCIASLFFVVHADQVGSKLFINNVNLKSDSVTTYFDIMDSTGTFNSNDIKKENVTASIGEKKLNLKSLIRFESANEGTTYVLMADISKSLNDKGKASIIKLFNELVNKIGSKDKIAVVTFGNTETVLQDFTSDKTILSNKTNSIEIKDDNTDLNRAVTKALDLLSNNQTLTTKKAIVIMSDGEESNDQGITKDEVLLRINQSHIPIFSVGLNFSGDKSFAEEVKVLGSFARLSNGQDFVLGDSGKTTTDIVSAITERIKKSFVAQFEKGTVSLDGKTSNFSLNVKLDDKTTVSANQDVLMKVLAGNTATDSTQNKSSTNSSLPTSSSTTSTVPFYQNVYYIGGAALVLVVLIVLIIVIVTMKKRKNTKVIENKIESVYIDNIENNGESKKNSNNDGKTVSIDSFPNQENIVVKTMPLSQQTKPSVKKGIKVRLIKLGKNIEESVNEFWLSDSIIVGRDPAKAKLVFENDEVLSSSHCEFILKDDKIFVNDLGSTNGTYVNGVPISGTYRLHNDDILLIGSMELRVCFDEALLL